VSAAGEGAFFCDTSVLVAASDTAHEHHGASLAVVSTARRDRAFCAAHTLAELYAVLTATPTPRRRTTADVLTNVQHAASVFTPIALNAGDYLWVLQRAAAHNVRSGQVYDALILKAAERAGAATIYTWNLRHFAQVAWPVIAARIRTP
jgi:predicted nucleic acid-binding protein